MLGSLRGEQQNRSDAAYRYQDSAKESAQRACVGTDPGRVFECVVEKVETAQAASQSEQDLAAQQQSAWAGMFSSAWSFGALVATALGLYWVKGTLDATRKGAEAAQGAVNETKRIGEAQVRCYLNLESCEIGFDQEGRSLTRITVKNYGQSPAVNFLWVARTRVTRLPRNMIESMAGYGVPTISRAIPINVQVPYGVFIAPGSTHITGTSLTDEALISQEHFECALNGATMTLVTVRIEFAWRDVFENQFSRVQTRTHMFYGFSPGMDHLQRAIEGMEVPWVHDEATV